MGTIDLHTHTTYSDGTFTPAELVRHAHSRGLEAIAITDHDTIGGISEAVETGRDIGIEVIPGVELSIEYDLPDHGHLHLLGLFIDPDSHELTSGLDWLRRKRDERTPRILRKLDEYGVRITEEEVMRVAGDGAVGRPHIARILVRSGHVSNMQEAFDRFLAKGAPAYVPKEKFSLDRAIEMVRTAGGLPVIAHPYSLELENDEMCTLLITMKRMGLAGIEAYYSNHNPEQTARFIEYAHELDLGISGGSDFHGENKPDIELGTGRGNLSIPRSILDDLLSRLG